MSIAQWIKTRKYDSIVIARLDEFLIREQEERDHDRRWDVNSPSSIGRCAREVYYNRIGEKGFEANDPKGKRIMDNGTGVHERMEGYLLKAGIALLNEIPVDYPALEIIGHGDLLLTTEEYTGNLKTAFEYHHGKNNREDWIRPDILAFSIDPIDELIVGEIKSINLRNFELLKDAKEEHKAQAMSYLLSLEEERKLLKKKFKTKKELLAFLNSKAYEKYFLSMYGHLESGSKYSRVEKLNNKFTTLAKRDMLLWSTESPIRRMTFIYECKNDQNIKEFTVEQDKELTANVVDFVSRVNKSVHKFNKLYRHLLWKNRGKCTVSERCKLVEMCAPPKEGNSKNVLPCRFCKHVGKCHIL